jgi:polygalacturonase
MVLVPKPHREIHGIVVTESKSIVISDITVTRAGDWSIVGFYVEDFKVSNVTVTDGYDGIHVRSGKKLVFENCKLYSRDDAIAGGYWVDALITDCTLNSACKGIRIVLPTINLEIRNCYIVGPGVFGHNRGPVDNPWITSTLTGIILQPGAWGKGAGKLDNIYIHDIIIKDVQTALTFVLNEGNTARDILVENVIATGISLVKGRIQLQSEAAEVFYKDIEIKKINHVPTEYATYFK